MVKLLSLKLYGVVPKWSYRDALEMRLSSNRHESSNLSNSANLSLKRFFVLGFFLGEIQQTLSAYNQSELSLVWSEAQHFVFPDNCYFV